MQTTIANIFACARIDLTASLTHREQMPVYRQPERLLNPISTAADHRADEWIVLSQHAVIEIELRVLADTPANVRADKPVVKLRGRGARGGKTVVQGVDRKSVV
jgi:hypothetical protein